ncbi:MULTISPECIES: OmpA family protein [unclassified Shinella]|uniref:OmpA family protein n=1 Tax=unclassified Shinella TaxID=2643062 RepID=UPI00234EB6E3|nr:MULTISPECIES: OmpA family protein [unclassified Shinella]MCO5149756.1 OmpA family protein [Shinella sp.]MDC7262336.1 OmpA family protein [Shinella sp. HY16]MDC7269231.1 OmpA family protein [Shinella sp. YZ44]
MTFRSRLFATVALPVLSTALIATPTLADALMKPFEVAQESTGESQPSEKELLLQQQQQQQDDEAQRAAEDEQQRQAEEQKAAEEAEKAAAEQQAAEEEAQRAAAEAEQRQAEEQKAAEEAERAAAEQKPAEDEAQRAAAEEEQRQAEEQKAAEEAERAAAEQKAAEDEAQRAAAEAEAQRQADEQKAAEEQKALDEQKPATEEQAEQPVQQQDGGTSETTAGESEQPAVGEGEQPAVAGEESPADTGTDQPATAETGETPVTEPVPEVVDTMTEAEKQEIAEDPAKTDETVVLPVENGAAVLDSDKDADNAGGQESREQRRKKREELRAQEEDVPVPETDDAAQATISEEVREAVPGRIEAAIKEEGKRVKEAPDFAVPETTNIINNTVINNTIINNNTVNNTTIDNSVTEVNIVERVENRTVLEVGDQLIVRGDDRPRLRRDSEEVYYDNLARGRVRETIVRPGGVEIVTIYNRYGDIIQRSRVGRDGREYILVYAPELEDDSPRPGLVDVGYELPPMRLRIPVSDYIIDTSSNPDRDYYDFLAEPPVERVERVYTIDEVKHSARLRDKVRRIDLDTITFATGSADVPMSQARTLRSVAEAMQKVLDKDPGETFLIEGHTDAVGSDKSNLVLSDERAESVASLLTDVYGIPPENLQTQGYGERFLKVKTQVAEQQNRRVTIRRVTTLVRPMARAN